MKRIFFFLSAIAALAAIFTGCSGVNSFKTVARDGSAPATNEITWSGYTNWWNSIYSQQVRSGNLSKIAVPDAAKVLEQRRRDLAEALGLPGLQMQEGFLDGLFSDKYEILENPSENELMSAFKNTGNVLAFVKKESELGKKLAGKIPEYVYAAPSYQTHGKLNGPDAFELRSGSKHLYAVVGTPADLAILKELIADTQALVNTYNMKRGWFGVQTDIRTVTCSPMTPIETMAAGMNEGNSWFVFSGEYERLIKPELERWIVESESGVEAAVGTHSIYDCRDWEGFQEQLLKDNQYEYAKERDARGGYLFRPIQDWGDYAGTGTAIYNGYYASAGNKEIVDTCSMPFVITNGNVADGATNPMVLFIPKGGQFNREAMWGAIMDRREVAIESAVEEFAVMGDAKFRNPVQLMMIERAFLENYFGDQVCIKATVDGTTLNILLQNFGSNAVKGKFAVTLPSSVTLAGSVPLRVSVPAGGVKAISVQLAPKPEAMGRRSAITISYDWGKSSKKTLAEMDMPQAVATHKLLYGTTSGCEFPVSVYNFTKSGQVEVSLKVSSKDDPDNAVLQQTETISLEKDANAKIGFNLKLKPGNYIAVASSQGASAVTQLGIGEEQQDAVKLWKEDVNGDGIDEVYMENSKVRVMLLAIGARVMEYYVKEKDDNVLFKNWPNEPYDPERPYRKRNFWPFGGFEDFLGQASVETHKVYDCEVVKDGGDCAEVRMVADYFGNTIEKVFTLYGDTPLLSIRFALDMVNPEFNVLGPQPILEVGKEHDEQDRIIVPEKDGLSGYVMDRADYWGKFLFPVEGWNVDYDTVEKIYFAGAFPVDQPFTLHMWHNHPRNRDTRFYYCELQPWMEIFRHNTTYFSYYMWAGGGNWEEGIQALRDRNLITEKHQ
ncbi:MAG: hypothetical protein J5801_02935 [Bacteroidales bacterium]|nr:hypothetical protein [Bacteroidales bacterium]